MLDIEKTCRNCGKVFKPYYGRQIYCCETCRLAVERTKRREQRNLESCKKIVDKNGQLLSNKTHLSISHAALFLNVSRPTIYKRIEAGELHPIKLGKNERMSYSRVDEVLEMPNLIEVQKNSYQWFIDKGLKEVLHDVSPICDFSGNLVLEFEDYYLDDKPK